MLLWSQGLSPCEYSPLAEWVRGWLAASPLPGSVACSKDGRSWGAGFEWTQKLFQCGSSGLGGWHMDLWGGSLEGEQAGTDVG